MKEFPLLVHNNHYCHRYFYKHDTWGNMYIISTYRSQVIYFHVRPNLKDYINDLNELLGERVYGSN